MAIQIINTGSSANAGDGDSIRTAFDKVNKNFHYIDGVVGGALSIEQGYTGSQGEYGYSGSQGYNGSQGYTGSRGAGYTGSASVVPGYTGSLGYVGSASDIPGYTGSKGYTGSASTASGYAGSAGFTGSIGYVGSASDTPGFTGSAGFTGSVGFVGSQGSGYTGSAGSKGYTGSKGDQGPQGFSPLTVPGGIFVELDQAHPIGTNIGYVYPSTATTTFIDGQAIRLRANILRYGNTPIAMGIVRADGGAGALLVFDEFNQLTMYSMLPGNQFPLSQTWDLSGVIFGINRYLTMEFQIIPDTANGNVYYGTIYGVGSVEMVQDNTIDLSNTSNGGWYLSVFSGNNFTDIADVSYEVGVGIGGAIGFTGSAGAGYTGSASTEIGYTGSSGTDGFTGSAGFTGSVGYIGSASTLPGYAGSLGYTGSQGVGFTGSQGAGYTGSAGYVGSQGVGFTGSTGIGYAGSRGVLGYTGSKGDQGIQGDQGLQGDIGYTGSTGFGFTGSAGVGYTGSRSTLPGPLGYTGSTGTNGFTGSAGSSGTNGFTGSAGSAGSNGFTGSAGANGFTGSQGVGFTGSQGVGFTGSQGVGFTGSSGAAGGLGFTGSAGFTGSSGTSGGTGFTGSTGSLGFTGSTGSLGFTGSQGDAGNNGFIGSAGNAGFTGSVGSAGYVGSLGLTGYTGSKGDKGDQGNQGIQGISVTLVASTSTSAGLPVTGHPGDGWIVNDTGHLWFWNTLASAWNDIGVIVGPQGYTGYSGSQGINGFVGSAGITGNNGFVGSQGNAGYAGSKGDIGYIGSRGNAGTIGYAGSQGEIGATGYIGSQGDVGYVGSLGYVGSVGEIGYTGSQGDPGISANQSLNTNDSVQFYDLTLTNGDDSNGTNGYVQARLTFNGSTDYEHQIRTRHSDNPTIYGRGNAFDFYTNANNSDGPNAPVLGLTIENGQVGIGGITSPQFTLDVGGDVATGSFQVKQDGSIYFNNYGSVVTESRPGVGFNANYLPTVAVTGGGTGCQISVAYSAGDTTYTNINTNDGGTGGYAIGDHLKVTGDLLGGTSPANDLIVVVTALYPSSTVAFSVEYVSGTPPVYVDGLHVRQNNYEWTFSNTGTFITPGDIVPDANNAYNLGSPDRQWNHIYVNTGSIYLGGIKLSTENNQLSVKQVTNIDGQETVVQNYALANADRLVNGTSEVVLNGDGNLTIPGNVIIGGTGTNNESHLVIDGANYWTSIQWKNFPAQSSTAAPFECQSQLLRVFKGSNAITGHEEMVAVSAITDNNDENGLMITTSKGKIPDAPYNDGTGTMHTFIFGGDGRVQFPDGTKQATAYIQQAINLDGGGADVKYDAQYAYVDGGFSSTRFGTLSTVYDGGNTHTESNQTILDGGGA